MPSHQLVRRPNPEIALHIFGQRTGGKDPHSVVTADAPGMVTHNLTESTAERRGHAEIARAQHPGPCHPNPMLAIFQNRADPTGDVLLEVVVLPTQKAGGRADPEGSVRRTEQGHDAQCRIGSCPVRASNVESGRRRTSPVRNPVPIQI